MTDARRVCDLSPLELLEAAIGRLDRFGWTTGRWNLELYVDEGNVRQLRAQLAGERHASVGRRALADAAKEDRDAA